MTIDEARSQIKSLQKFIETLEAYEPQNFEQEALKLYVELESVSKVAVILKDKGYKIGNRKVNSNDISDLIRSKATDVMHEMAKKTFKKGYTKMRKFS